MLPQHESQKSSDRTYCNIATWRGPAGDTSATNQYQGSRNFSVVPQHEGLEESLKSLKKSSDRTYCNIATWRGPGGDTSATNQYRGSRNSSVVHETVAESKPHWDGITIERTKRKAQSEGGNRDTPKPKWGSKSIKIASDDERRPLKITGDWGRFQTGRKKRN